MIVEIFMAAAAIGNSVVRGIAVLQHDPMI
jgi:hypothetical protein